MDNAVLKALRSRRSIRRFKPGQISDAELQAVLEAGTWAPTAHGLQDPWIVAVQKPELKERISKLNASVWGREDFDPFYGAPTYVLVFASRPEKTLNGVPDGSLVLGNMMLAAHSIGLGSCWINREREMFETPDGKALMAELGLPEELQSGLMGVGALALGYPAHEAPAPKPRKEAYWRVIK
ncbi:MAG: nitroreductase [Bacteroidales bacterium]|nr:nitroreductase [Bacteroidales bacterium]